jgi:hypothetical protein
MCTFFANKKYSQRKIEIPRYFVGADLFYSVSTISFGFKGKWAKNHTL